ncbi:hypothetical protein HPB51_006973 [Rhipicephalus microplus]|uniref:Uncharacterized protein n=1 Tax=Rhipicephalus microplus TaxID=6941 RepID=A0A9J6ES61_RHIMP|nr:hypothetical protein HPB51_006973 [Rhipicephalus microplus]
MAEAISVSCTTTANCSTEATVFEPDAEPGTGDILKNFESVTLPAAAWAHHKINGEGQETVVFSEMHVSNAAFVAANAVSCAVGMAAEVEGYNYYAAPVNHIYPRKVVSFDDALNINIAFLGRRIAKEQLGFLGNIRNTADIETLIFLVHNVRLCSGGPYSKEYPNAQPSSAYVDVTSRWRQPMCPSAAVGRSFMPKMSEPSNHTSSSREAQTRQGETKAAYAIFPIVECSKD